MPFFTYTNTFTPQLLPHYNAPHLLPKPTHIPDRPPPPFPTRLSQLLCSSVSCTETLRSHPPTVEQHQPKPMSEVSGHPGYEEAPL